ncbi:MAG: IS66 family transposase zinc-finger binding domain-containing protein [Pseudomonadota bacterium]
MRSHETASLPDDVAALKAMIAARDAELYAQALLIEKLKLQLAAQNRHRFGARSEGLDQLALAIEKEGVGARQEAPAALNAEPRAQGRPKRQALPEHLPRQTVVHTPVDRCCRDCGKPLRKMGEDMREVLDFVPGRFVVRRHVCEKFSCRDCGGIVEGQLPSMPIEKGLPGAGLLAHVLVSKFCDHLPLL